ncbi:MAG: DUF3006 domain-containing protein [Thermoleophilia bacterium]
MTRQTNCYLDRFEGDKAVLIIDGMEAFIPRILLPKEVSEGDYLKIDMSIDDAQRKSVSAEITELQDRMKSGDGEPR